MFNVLDRHAFTSRSLKAKHKLATGNRRRQARKALFYEPLETRLLMATAPLGDQFVVADTLGFTATPAAIAVHSDGSFVTAWESFEQDGSGFGVFAQRFDASGAEVDAVPFLVNSTTSREQSAPAIAADAAGNVLIVWQSKGQDEGDTFGVYGQWYDSSGATMGGEFRINTTTAGDQKAPSVAIDESGDAIIVWQSVGAEGLADTETDDWGVYYARLDGAGGTTPSGELLVNDAIAGNQQNPTVAASANGNFVIAWEAIDPLGGDDASLDIYAKVFNSAGNHVTLGEQLVNSDQLRDQVAPQVAVDADGDFAIVWVGGGIPGSGSDVFGQRFNQSGIRQGQQFRVNDTTLASQVGGVVAMDAAGNFVVTWQSVHQDGFSEGIYARAYDAAGTILVGETLVNTVTEGPQSLPSIGINASGRAVATWHSKNDEHQSALFAQRFNLTTTAPFLSKVGSEMELAALVELEGSKAGAAMDHQNRSVVVFESYDEDGDAMGVYAQMLDEFGDPLGERFLVNTGVTAGIQGAPAVARAPDGRFVIVWQSKSQDSDGYDIYAQLYTAAGDPDPDGTAFQVNTTIVGNQMTPAVAMGEDGRFVVVWQGDDGLEDDGLEQDVADGTTDIFAQRFEADGTPVGSEFQVNQFEGTNQNMPAVTMNAAGQFAIAWVSSHPSLDVVEGEEATDTEKSIFVQWYDANGVSNGPEVIAHVYVKDAQESPQIGMDAEGHFVVAWQSINQESEEPDGGTWGVYGRQFNNQKVPLTTAEFRINEETAGLQRLVGLGVDADGNFVVAYESTVPENTDGISTDIYRREFFPDGSSNGSENIVNTWSGGPQVLPVVARASTGNYGIFWSGQGFSHIDGVHGRLYDISLLDDPGQPSRVPVGDQFLVSPTLGFEFSSPAIAVHEDGTFTIAFESFEEDTSGFGIFTQQFNANGTAIPASRAQVNTTVLDDQSDPAIAGDGEGNVLIVWQSKDSSGYGIFGQWLDADGNNIGTQFVLNSTLTADQTNPDVAVDETGRAIIVWESTGQVDGNGAEVVYVTLDSVGDVTPSTEQLANASITGDQLAPRVAASARDAIGGNNQFVITWQGPGPAIEGEEVTEATVDVFARRLDSTGATNGGEFVVNSIAEHDQILPDLGMDAAGNVVFVWQAEGQQGSGSDVYARQMTAAGVLSGADELVNTTTTRPQRLPSVAMDAAGNYLVSWQSQHQDGYSWGIYRQGFDSNGARVGEEVIVNHRVEGPQTAPTVASNSNGEGIVAWLGNSATHQPSVFAHRFDLPATEVEGEILLTSYVGLEDSAPAAAMNALRESVVVWESYAEVEDGSSGLGVFGQLLDAQGLPLGGRFLVNENIVVGNQGAPAVARAPSGEFVIAWQTEVVDGSYDIYARRYNADGTPAADSDIFLVNTTTTGDQKAPTVAIGPDGRFVIAWQSDHGHGSTDIMAQRYFPGGAVNGGEFRVNNETALDQYDPSIAMNSSGEFVIAWVSNHPAADPATMDDDSEKSIFVQWFNAEGIAASGDEVLVHRYVKDAQEAPAIGMDVTGRFVVAWQSINQDGNSWGVFAQRFNADKTPIDRREITVNQTRMGPQRFAGLGVDQYGRFVVAWQSNERAELTDTGSGGGGGGGEPGTPEGSSWDLYSRQYSFDGSPEGGEIFVNTWQMGPQTLPVVAQAPGGDFGIFWLGQAPDHIEGVNGRLYQSLFEFGDAPDPTYPTLLASDGARHLPFSPLYLGAGMDGEFDGQPSMGATGDDADASGDDEDGVRLPIVLVSGYSGNVSVTASAAGKLDAWIDFDNDGTFEPSEAIATSLDVASGTNTISVAIPGTTGRVSTYARFRISSAGGLMPTGVALDGEVEDYPVQIVLASETIPPVLDAIADQTVVADASTNSINLVVTDADTAIEDLTFTAVGDSKLYLLDQQYDLDTYQNGTYYFFDVRGSDEKYLYNENTDTWFYILANGDFYQFNGNRDSTEPASLSGILITNVGTDVYANPTLLHEAISAGDDLNFQFTTGQNPTLVVSANPDALGTYLVTVTVSDGFNTDSDTFEIIVTPSVPPVLDAIADQTVVAGTSTNSINLVVTDADTVTEDLTFTAIGDSKLYLLDQQYDLDTYQNGTSYFFDVRGSDEKYLYNENTDTWFYILANGDFYQFTGNRDSTEPASLSGILITNVGTDVYANPTLLHEAISVSDDLNFQFTTGQNPTLVVSANPDALGTYLVTVTVSDGFNTDSDTFEIIVTPSVPPVLDAIADQTVVAGTSTNPINLVVADADTATEDLTFTAIGDSKLYLLDQEYDLDTYQNGTNYFFDVRGSDEKYLYNAQADTWFYILPNGNLYQFTGNRDSTEPASLSGTLITNVGVEVYADPSLLHEAVSVSDDLDFQFTTGANPSLIITPDADASGTYLVTVTASDGVNIDTETIVVVVTPTAPPVLNIIASQTVEIGDSTGVIDLSVSDPDTATADLAFTATANSELYVLDQQYDLDTYQNGTHYFFDVRGSDEKYLYNVQTDTWFYILANGDFYQFTGNRDSTAPASLSGNLIANVGTEVYANPTLLHEAISVDDALTFQFNPGLNPTLIVSAVSDAEVGKYLATVTASDGVNVDFQTFLVVVTDSSTLMTAQSEPMSSESVDAVMGSDDDSWLVA